uniref:3-ketoacyl-CoA synthase n=1 Tax=Kalanchoe fedtschenkoi TaxID=63787 RepID=A0A7N0V6R9_KALFE
MELIWLLLLSPVILFALKLIKMIDGRRHQHCYLLSYKLFKAPEDRHLSQETCGRIILRNRNLRLEEYKFLLRAMVGSGMGQCTSGPPIVLSGNEDCPRLGDVLAEMEEIMFSTLDQLLESSGFRPEDIDILVVNVTSFTSLPSLSARIVNRFRMRDDIKVYNLTGMGCSANLIAIDMVHKLFKTHKKALAAVVGTEAIGQNWYCGRDRSMMMTNCLFRSGGCSMLLTNDTSLKSRAILKLDMAVRTHIGANDEAYNCCIQVEDDMGCRGFRLSKSLPRAGGKALVENFKVLLPKILPVKELVRYVSVLLLRKKVNSRLVRGMDTKPNLKAAINHFCIHTGGRAVIDEIGKSLGLKETDVEPSRVTLHRFGNTSCASVWYILGYMEAKKRLKRGDKVLMIGLGSGFKCATAVWEVLKDLEDRNVWDSCVDAYPERMSTDSIAGNDYRINGRPLDSLTQEDVEELRSCAKLVVETF